VQRSVFREQHDLENLIRQCPLKIRTNNGREYLVEKSEFITVGDYTASNLFDDAGVKRHAIVGRINISAVVPEGATSGA
jgi:hypothetical protein